MDEHFRKRAVERNMPALMGLLAVWYNDFFGAETHAVLPYDQYSRGSRRICRAGDDGEPGQVA